MMEKISKTRAFSNRNFLVKSFSLIVLIIFSGFPLFSQGYEIKVKINPLKQGQIILGHHFGGIYYPDDTVNLDSKGIGIFRKSKPLPQGMYFVLLPSKRPMDIIVGQDQSFTVETDTVDLLKSAKAISSVENELFFDFSLNQQKIGELIEQKKNSSSETKKDSINKALTELNKELIANINKIINERKDLYFSKFLKAAKDIEVPDPPKDSNGILDSTFQYRYYKAHYFDNFDYTDPSLLRSPIYEKKVKDYIEKVIPQIPDSINKELDIILTKAKSNNEVFRYLLVTFFNSFAASQIMGFDAVFIHLAETFYIPYATWSDKDYIEKLKKEIAKHKPTLIGGIAPNLKLVQIPAEHFIAAKNDTALKSNPYVGNYLNIHDVKGKFTVIAFWEADCGHCKKAIPELHKIYEEDLKSKGVKVLAVHTISSVEGKRKWIDFVNEHSLTDWVNAWSPYSLEFRDIYDVYSTPVIIVVDENEKIIAKKISPEQVKEIIDFELKKEKK